MDKYINRFPEQLLEALTIGEGLPPMRLQHPVSNIVICGMGGSGIGGAFVKELLQHTLSIPVIINQEYTLPAFADEHTFVICSSYSGNTEETISALKDAIAKKCTVACITTGGELEKIAIQHQLPLVKIPGGMPPRTCLGYSLTAQLYILFQAGFISDTFKEQIRQASEFLKNKSAHIRKIALALAGEINNRLPIIYTSSNMEAMGQRWKQQINENAKKHCFANVVPEMNHNELVAYSIGGNDIAVILLRDTADDARIQKRFDIMKELISGKAGSINEYHAEGENAIEKMFYLIHLGDWVSYYLAEQNGINPIAIDILDELKQRLTRS